MSTETPEPTAASTPLAATAVPKRSWLWKVLGLRRREGRFLRIGLTLWGWVLMIGVVLMGGMAGFAEYSMQPDFCRSCHIMEPYYEAWHQSSHKGVACPLCHFEPGAGNAIYGKFQASSQAVKYITHTYGSKPYAEIRDASCMREECHSKRLLEGKVNWTVPTEGGHTVTIHFDHTPHLKELRRGQQLRCVSCHSQLVQGKHIVVTTDTCFLCHFKGLKHGRDDQTIGTCKGCHDAPKGVIRTATGNFDHAEYLARGVLCQNCHSDSVKGDGAVPRQVCWNCHNQTPQIARYGETQFIHQTHVTEHKVECSSCHVQIEHNLTAGALRLGSTPEGTKHILMDNGNCGMCHEQTHGGPLEMFSGTGGRGVPDMPSPMYRAQVDCIACHESQKNSSQKAEVTGQTFVATQARCDYCHGQKYSGMLDVWKKTLNDSVVRAEVSYGAAVKRFGSSEIAGIDRLEVQRLLDDAGHNIRLVKLGQGLHNITYATAILNVATENCKKAGNLLDGNKSEVPKTP